MHTQSHVPPSPGHFSHPPWLLGPLLASLIPSAPCDHSHSLPRVCSASTSAPTPQSRYSVCPGSEVAIRLRLPSAVGWRGGSGGRGDAWHNFPNLAGTGISVLGLARERTWQLGGCTCSELQSRVPGRLGESAFTPPVSHTQHEIANKKH